MADIDQTDYEQPTETTQPGPAAQLPAAPETGTRAWIATPETAARWGPAPPNQGEKTSPELNLQRATRMRNYLMQNPQWFSNPQTKHAANGVLKIVTDVVGNNLRMKQLQNASVTAKNNSLETKLKLKDADDFIKRASLLAPEDRAPLYKISKNEDGSISPSQWEFLTTAERTTAARSENARKLAEIEARQTGTVATTTTADKASGVTKVFRPETGGSKIHFAPNGQVLSVDGENVKELRPENPPAKQYTGLKVAIPASDAGPYIEGPSDHPEIIARQKVEKELYEHKKKVDAYKANNHWWKSNPLPNPDAEPPKVAATETTASPAATPAANTPAAGVTIMVNPKTGQSVEVPQSEVERARKLGYQ